LATHLIYPAEDNFTGFGCGGITTIDIGGQEYWHVFFFFWKSAGELSTYFLFQ